MNKQIEEMAKIIRDFAKELDGKCIYLLATCEDDKLKDSVHAEIAEALHNAGYKQEKETAREILQELIDKRHLIITFDEFEYEAVDINKIITLAETYGVEVE